MPPSSDGLSAEEVEAYLNRLGLTPASIGEPDRSTLARLQRAHVTTVPFENLAITGDPCGERVGEGVVLSGPHLYDKIVERGRGGYCFELNGLFYALLIALGYDADRIAARVLSDGAVRTPANHHPLVVELDRRYVVDVGTGPPMIRRPLPLPGTTDPDAAGVAWRVTESERPDAPYRVDCRGPHEPEWTPRYVFDDGARPLHYFAAANDYLQTAPESPFTGEPIVARSTADGYRKLSGTTLVEVTPSGQREHSVPLNRWHHLLERHFGIRYEHP
jgi:N-hydroxyarylamine O-acetyltransferase